MSVRMQYKIMFVVVMVLKFILKERFLMPKEAILNVMLGTSWDLTIREGKNPEISEK